MQDISLNFNVAGDERKKLVKAVGAYKQVTPEYLGVPSFAFRIDEMIIDKDGILIIEGGMEPEKLQEFLKYLEEKGFHTTVAATEDTPTEDTPTEDTPTEDTLTEDSPTEDTAEPAAQAEYEMEPEDTPTEEPTLLTIEVPRDGFTEESIINLQKIIDSKASLLRKALGTDDLSVQISEDRIAFSWFHIEDPANTSAYAHLVSALCQMAQKAKRVTAKEKPVESEKYAMRIWLQRLGFGGAEFKEERALLLKNLSCTSAFKNQAEAEAFNEKLKAKRANKAESGVAI